MINIGNLKYGRMYKNQKIRFLPLSANKNKNSILFVLSESLDQTITFLNSNDFNLQYYKSFYTPYRESYKFTLVEKRYAFNQSLTYDRIKAEVPHIKTMKRDIKTYQQLNLVYDLSEVNKTFLVENTLPPKRKATMHFDLFNKVISDPRLTQYKEKYVYIPFSMVSLRSIKDFKNPVSIEGFLQSLTTVGFNEPEKLNNLKDVTFVIHEPQNNILFKFNVDLMTTRPNFLFKSLILLSKVVANEPLTSEEKTLFTAQTENTVTEKLTIEDRIEDISDQLTNFITDKFLVGGIKGLTGKNAELTDKAKEVIKEVAKEKEITSAKELTKELEDNEELVKIVAELSKNSLTKNKSVAMSKRDELIRAEHQKVLVDGKHTLSEILNDFNDKKLDRQHIDKLDLIYDDLLESTNKDFEVSYVKKQYMKDQTMILDSFSKGDREIHMFIRNIEREDTSDTFTKKETLTVHFEDENRVKHTFKIDIPKIVDDKYLYINGNKKGFVKQLILKPVVKTAPDTVQVVTNYNKIFLTRYGVKTSPKIEKLKKTLSSLQHRNFDIKKSDNSLVNVDYLTNIEYDEFAKDIFSIHIKDLFISFNQTDIRKHLAEINFDVMKLQSHQLPIGIENKKVIILDVNKNIVEGTNLSLSDYIVERLKDIDPKIEEEIAKVSVGKRYMYTKASVLSREIPLILLLAYKDGLTTVMNKANINYTFTDKRPNLSVDEKNSKGVVQFADGYLVYDLYPLSNSLLLNALPTLPTREYEYELFDQKEVYLEIFNTLLGSRTIGKGLDNNYQLFLDPITLEVVRDLGIPEDFTELFIYANRLLEDNTFKKENDMSIYRIRSAELINAYLYRILADAYRTYKDSKNASTPIKVSVPQDKLIKELLMSLNTEDVNILNPIISATSSCTYKGLSGLNMEQGYKLDKRAYSNSMMGIMGISSPYNASVGITRELVYNSNITSVRGYLDSGDNQSMEDLNPGNMLTAAELITTFAAYCLGIHDSDIMSKRI